MTRDSVRDREALGLTNVSRYCAECGRAIPIGDERTEERDWQAHLDRHRPPEREGHTQ